MSENQMNPFPDTLPDGHQWVAAIRQPLSLPAMSEFCRLIGKAFGGDAKVHPNGDWVVFSGRTPKHPELPKTEDAHAEDALPYIEAGFADSEPCGCCEDGRPTAGPLPPNYETCPVSIADHGGSLLREWEFVKDLPHTQRHLAFVDTLRSLLYHQAPPQGWGDQWRLLEDGRDRPQDGITWKATFFAKTPNPKAL